MFLPLSAVVQPIFFVRCAVYEIERETMEQSAVLPFVMCVMDTIIYVVIIIEILSSGVS